MEPLPASRAERAGRNREAAGYDTRQLAEKGASYWRLHNRLILDALRGAAPGRLLDAGCGTGLVTEALTTLERDLLAVDFSEASLAVLQQKALPRVHLVQADLTRLPLPPNSLCAIISSLVLQHIAPAARQRVYLEFARCLIPGGKLVVVAYNEAKFRRRGLASASVFGSGIPYYAFSARQLRDQAAGAGFGKVLVRPLGMTLYARGYPGGQLLYPVLARTAHWLEWWSARLLPPNRSYVSDYWLMSAEKNDAGG